MSLCDCGEHQTTRHIVNECPLTCFDGLHFRITPSTGCGLQLAAETKFEIVKANDNNNMARNDDVSCMRKMNL